MRIGLLISVLLFSSTFCFAGKDKPQYAVDKIKKEVRLSENSVVRNHEVAIELSASSASFYETKVVTVLNKEGYKHYEDWVVFYGNKENVSDILLLIYDEDGKEIVKIKSKDFDDLAAHGSNLYTDRRLKHIAIHEQNYPFTIEFSYRKKVRDTYLILPRWELSEVPDSYVEHSSLLINKPASIDFSIDYRLHGYELEEKEISDNRIYFSAKNIPSLNWEDFGPQRRYQKPHIILSPHHFDIEGYEGSFENWQTLGDFYYRINKDRYEIEEDFVAPIKDKVNAASTTADKVSVVYDYLQEKTRYVSVQLGIGGWQSFPAEYVEKNSYGDCKALTTYTKSLLSYFDIEAQPVLIYATNEGLNNSYELSEDIAYSGFNHVILAVPEEKDTIWLECTSQIQPFNYLGTFTMDGKGLVVKPDGESHLVSTPKTTPETDLATKSIEVDLEEDGSAKISYSYKAKGIMAESLFKAKAYLSKEDFEDRLADIIDMPNSELEEYTFKKTDESMEIELNASFTSKNIANKTGSRLFLKPFQFQTERGIPDDIEDRKHSFILPYAFQKNLEVVYHLPNGYSFETAEVDPVELESKTGSYQANYTIEENKLTVTSQYTRKQGHYPPEIAEEYGEFANSMNQVLKRMAVLKSVNLSGDN